MRVTSVLISRKYFGVDESANIQSADYILYKAVSDIGPSYLQDCLSSPIVPACLTRFRKGAYSRSSSIMSSGWTQALGLLNSSTCLTEQNPSVLFSDPDLLGLLSSFEDLAAFSGIWPRLAVDMVFLIGIYCLPRIPWIIAWSYCFNPCILPTNIVTRLIIII